VKVSFVATALAIPIHAIASRFAVVVHNVKQEVPIVRAA
jgi:hypothetical protein